MAWKFATSGAARRMRPGGSPGSRTTNSPIRAIAIGPTTWLRSGTWPAGPARFPSWWPSRRGEILGSATLESEEAGLGDDPIEPGTINLRMLGVDPEARGRGAGRALVEECVRRARAARLNAVTLHTIAEMKVAQRLYESMGFVRDPARDWQVTEDFTLYAFRLDL